MRNHEYGKRSAAGHFSTPWFADPAKWSVGQESVPFDTPDCLALMIENDADSCH